MLELVRNQVVRIRLNPKRIWRWHLWLIEDLARSPVADLSIFEAAETVGLPGPVLTLMSLEKLIYGLPGEHACDLLSLAQISKSLSRKGLNAPTGDASGDIVL